MKTVLVVENDREVRDTLRDVLDMHECEVHCAGDGADALLLLRKMRFDVVITDYRMPGLNGAEMARRARRDYPHLYIIGISGECTEEVFLAAGANTFLGKPFGPEELLVLIPE